MIALADTISERELLQTIVDAATSSGLWLVYHTYDSRRSAAGFPDLVLVGHPDRRTAGCLVFVEAKTSRGRTSAAQELWLRALERNVLVAAMVVRPQNLDDLLETLAGAPGR